MHVRKCSFGLGLMVVVATAAGCGSDPMPSGPRLLTIAGADPSVTHDAALSALLDVVRKRVPGIEITFPMTAGVDPPDVFMVGGGADFLDWAATGRLASIDELLASERWESVFHPETLQVFKGNDGHLYGVPLVIERDNTMFFNRDVFDAAGVAPPTSVADWFVAADELRAAGKTPLGVSASAGWK